MNATCKVTCEKIQTALNKINWLPGLLARIAIGFVFIESGWGKLQHLPKIVDYFTELGIPFPQIQAPFVAGVELVCGALLLVGLLTRVASIPLIGTMVVAILTAKKEDIHTLTDLLGMSEFLIIVALVTLVFSGAGTLSVDNFCCKRCKN